ncbi:hypothetical protein [Haloarcula sebkhae]|uniref:Uncharacterized protein n=2 Tax=Haloarcula sebkhae TaxID=932660 RepID=A0ACC6VNE0_9EURY|nr:hypothetical protein [Haloarcula sebkhae]GGK83390.1 hypothetical protein GCM10009067_39540 [Haloarcula sebkhae]
MSEIEGHLSQLSSLWKGREITEEPRIIDIDSPVSDLSKNDLSGILQLAHEEGNYFDDFEVTFHTDRAGEQPILQSGGSLRVHDPGFDTLRRAYDTEDVAIQDWRKIVSDVLHDDEVERLAEFLLEWSGTASISLHIDCIVDKSEIGDLLKAELEGSSSFSVFFWTEEKQFQSWLDQHISDYATVADLFFQERNLPVFVFYQEIEPEYQSVLQFHSVKSLLNLEPADHDFDVSQYRTLMDRDRDVLQAGPELSVVSPSLFSTPKAREHFASVFVYSVFAGVAKRVRLTEDVLELEIKTRRKTISNKIDGEAFTNAVQQYTVDELTALYEFYESFVEKGTRDTYRDFWHRSIVEECDSFEDLPRKTAQIREFYTFLEEEAIEKNFDDLNDAIQDAHVFTADVTSTVSETTRSLTSEIQKVVLALLGAVFANLFLVVRWSNVDMVLPFSIFVISGVLLFYFPTIQTRIDELDDLISESNDDFKVYSETIQEFSGHLFDFSRFDDRRGSYVNYAEKRRKWAVKKLQLAFWLLIIVWGGLAIISILGYSRSSGQFLIATTSVVVAGVIWFRHRDADYYPETTDVPVIGPALSPAISLAILILVVAGIRLFIEPLTVDAITSGRILQEVLSWVSSSQLLGVQSPIS